MLVEGSYPHLTDKEIETKDGRGLSKAKERPGPQKLLGKQLPGFSLCLMISSGKGILSLPGPHTPGNFGGTSQVGGGGQR